MESNISLFKFNNSIIKNNKINNSRNNSNNISIIYQSQRNNEKVRSKSENEINTNSIEEETNKYIEELKKGTYNILVAVRCRPLNQKEKDFSSQQTLNIINKKLIILKDPNGITNINNNRSKEISMAFDYVFDEYESQENIFNSTTKFLIEGVVNGFNATVFAYGATGAGKTYTMLGNEKNPGIMPLTLKELFNKINSYPNREYNVKLWYLEIYNENIRDLLSNNNESNLDLREDQNKGIIVSGITEIKATSSEHILNILKKGNKNRTTESTNANETSSRSHAILQIMVSYKEKNSGIDYEIKYGKLNLIDLAGSERASVTLNRGNRLIEGANINRSLLTLGNCINALCEANEKGSKSYIPYRDSKLTRLLKDSLGGNARTVMIANVSPSILSFDDTYNTLNYANRAKKIKSNVKRNVLNAKYHISNYTNIIKNLQSRIYDLESQIGHQRDMTLSPTSRKSDYENKKFIEKIKIICDNQIKVQKKIVGNNYEVLKLKKKIWDEGDKDDNIKDKIQKTNELVEKYSNSLKEINKTVDSYSNKLDKLNELEKDYALILINNSKNKVSNINLAYKIILIKERIDKLNEYIKELEDQIIIRDNILSNKKIIIEDLEIDLKNNYKSLNNLRDKYKDKKEKEANGIVSNGFFKDNSPDNSRLPPLSNTSINSLNKTEVDRVLSNIRDVNNSINNINIKLKNFDNNNNKTLLRPKSSINIIQNKSYISNSPKKNKTKFFPISNQFKVKPVNNNIRQSFIPKNILINNVPESAKQIKGKMRNNINIKYRIKNRSVLTEQNSENSHQSYGIETENIRANQIIINGAKIDNESKRFHSNNNNNISFNSSGENGNKDKSYPKLVNVNVFKNSSYKTKSPITKVNFGQKKKIPFKI